jgi:hypothetical protein
VSNEVPHNTDAKAAQAVVFTALPLYQQIFITDIVLGPAAAVALARRNAVDLNQYDWWRAALTPQARRALEAQARQVQRGRKAEALAITQAAQASPYVDWFNGTTRHKARNPMGRAK